MNKRKPIDGDDLIYRLLMSLLDEDNERAQALVGAIVRLVSVWFPPDFYQRHPVLLPWVVRDPSCRPRKKAGEITVDQWGAPTTRGFLRDDNSLIKNIPKSLVVDGPTQSPMRGGRLGSGFVASHVWREVNLEELASRNPRLNSFVPNLVWLPRQIAKLSDREGGPVQNALKSMSIDIYRSTTVEEELKAQVENIWSLLPPPPVSVGVDTRDLHYFKVTPKFIKSRMESARQVLQMVTAIATGSQPRSGSRIPSRYEEGIHSLPIEAVEHLRQEIALWWSCQ